MKTCVKCGETKPLDAFYRMAGMRDGYRNDCKACNLAAKAQRHRENPGPARERVRAWQLANPDKVRAKQAEYRATGRKRVADRRSYLKRKYGITLEQYDELLAAQGGVCGICGAAPRDDISLHVDHDHGTGERRGLLCFRCNNALGDFADDSERLYAAVEYLADHDPEQRALAVIARERVRLLLAS
ncbi:MAG TPA: endonuclease VII domain-containing protein [Acidimicrobiales bacterium]